MATFAKNKLSGSTDGRAILITTTATAGTLIHTAVAGTGTDFDEVWLWAMNNSSEDRILTLEWGGVTAPNDLVKSPIRVIGGLVLIMPGLILQNTTIVRAFAAVANDLQILGFVNEIR